MFFFNEIKIWYLLTFFVLAERQQMNLASGFIDGSDLYNEGELQLRTYSAGQANIENCKK